MDQLEVRAKDAVVDALQEMAHHEVNGEGLSYGGTWALVGEADSLVTYKQPDPSNSSITVSRTFGRIRADMDDALGFFYSETSDDFLAVSQLSCHETHDARVISTVRKRTAVNPYSYLGIKYLCVQPVPGIPPRDQVFLEYIGFAQDSKGRAVGFHATLPLNPQETPPLGPTMRVPRVEVTNVLLIRTLENHTGHCAVFSHGTFNLRESSGNMNVYLRKYMETLRDVAVLMDSKRISSEELLSKHNWVPDSLRKSCYVCTRSFGATRHRHHCRLCGEVVCKKCLVTRDVTGKVSEGRSGKTKLKVCMFCVQKTRSKSATEKGSFGLPSLGGHDSPLNRTVSSSIDRQSMLSDASSVFSFDIGFEIRSPSRRYSDMSVASTIFEREDGSQNDSFTADLYIDTREMVPAPFVSSQDRYKPQHMRQTSGTMSIGSQFSPLSSRSSSSGGSSSDYSSSNGSVRNYTHVPQYHAPPYHASPYHAPPNQLARQGRSTSLDHNRQDFQFNHMDQQLAEQQEILRRLALASNYPRRTRDPYE